MVLAGIGWLLLFAGFGFSEDPVAQSQWTASPLQLDGLAEEWRSDSLLHVKKIDLDYGFRNDGRNLYILLVFRNPKSLSSIDAVGITISGSPEGTEHNNNKVRFIKKTLTADQFIAMLEYQGAHLTGEKKEELRRRPQHPVLAAYAVDKKGKILSPTGSATGVEPPAFQTTKQENGVTYEFRIPLASREVYPAGIEAEPGTTISVSFKWGGSAQKTLSPRTSWSTPWSMVSGGALADNGETRAQEFLNSYDSMSRPSLEGKKYALRVDVQLAKQVSVPDIYPGVSSLD
jgi:hypothetical protein